MRNSPRTIAVSGKGRQPFEKGTKPREQFEVRMLAEWHGDRLLLLGPNGNTIKIIDPSLAMIPDEHALHDRAWRLATDRMFKNWASAWRARFDPQACDPWKRKVETLVLCWNMRLVRSRTQPPQRRQKRYRDWDDTCHREADIWRKWIKRERDKVSKPWIKWADNIAHNQRTRYERKQQQQANREQHQAEGQPQGDHGDRGATAATMCAD